MVVHEIFLIKLFSTGLWNSIHHFKGINLHMRLQLSLGGKGAESCERGTAKNGSVHTTKRNQNKISQRPISIKNEAELEDKQNYYQYIYHVLISIYHDSNN